MSARGNQTNGKYILVIDDDESIRETLKLALEVDGHVVFTAVNGREAIAVLNKMPHPCLILLDLMMPIMSGFEFMDTINADTALASLPVVVMTAFSEKAFAVKEKQVIEKPIDVNALYSMVNRYCG